MKRHSRASSVGRSDVGSASVIGRSIRKLNVDFRPLWNTDQISAIVVCRRTARVGAVDRTIRVWQRRDGRWTGAVQFVADARILVFAFSEWAGVLAAGDESWRAHFLHVDAGH